MKASKAVHSANRFAYCPLPTVFCTFAAVTMQLLQKILKYDKLVFLLSVGLFFICIYYGITRRMNYLFAIPAILVFAVLILENFRLVWYIALLAMPVSVNLHTLVEGSSIQFPSDLLSLALVGIFLFKILSEKDSYYRYYRHPIAWVIFFYLLWQIFALIGANDAAVSAKYILMLYWFVIPFYFIGTWIFAQPKSIIYFYFLIGTGFTIAMLIIMGKYVMNGKNPFLLRFNPMPVFRDHTLFGAFTVFFIPMFLLFAVKGKFSRTFRVASFIIFMFFVGGLFFSYSRGAWAASVAGLGLMVVFLMRHYIRLLALPIAVTIIAGGIFLYKSYTDVLLRNDAVSRKGFSEHVMSMTNFTTDDSNVERLNRWQCAMQMYRERPVLGFGPGSYAFEYGKYQRGANMTKISTNHGDNGTAHNEFFLAISETGLPGLIITILLFFVPIIMGMRGYIRATEHNIRLIYLGATFGLVSYLLLAGVNNFLDQDKVAIAFFGTLAIITALDIRSYRVASHGT